MGDNIEQLVKAFMNLPGIGPRQAQRFVFHLLQNPRNIGEFVRGLSNLAGNINQCTLCYRYFPKEKSGSSICKICSSRSGATTLLVVEKDVDLMNVEKSGTYKGLYFVLGGLVPILEKEPEKKVRTKELLARISELSINGLKEVILALSASPTGDHTNEYLQEFLSENLNKSSITLSMLGRGLSTGTEIEYSDPDTLASALERRTTRVK